MNLLKRFRKKNGNLKGIKETTPTERPPDWNPEQTEQVIAKTTNAAFLEAWRMHWMDLDESEKVEWSFQEVKSPLKVQKTIEDMDKLHREHSTSRKIAAKTLRFFEALETLMSGVAIGIQSNPEVSAIVVGVLRVVINVAVKYFEYYEKLSQMLERLAEHIVIFDLFTQNNSDEQILHRTLVVLYRNILAFCRYARRAFVGQGDSTASNSLAMFARVQWAPFEQQFGQIQSNLEHYTKNLDMVSTAIILNSSLAIRDNLEKKRSLDIQQERKNFLDWICKYEIEEIHGIIREKRHPNTGLWLLEDRSYKSWISGKDTHPLWLSGPAGTGKSVLASMVIDHLKDCTKYPDYTVAYMYFKGEEVNTKHLPSRVMSMLVKQLCWNLETLPEKTLQFFRDFEKNARQHTYEDLKSVFIDCAGHLGTVVVVLDAFDECERRHRSQLSTFIRDIGTHCTNVKVIVTSRWERDIENSLNIPLSFQISMNPSAEDIAKCVRHRVEQEFRHITPDLREKITNQLIEKSAGSFLWVDLQLNDLVQIPQSDIETQLTMLPSGLSDTYIECLRSINAQPRANRLLAQTCFIWALYSYRLTERSEFCDLVSLEAKLSEDRKEKYGWMEIEGATKQLIIGPGYWGRVRPLHFSFKEFILNPECPIPVELQCYIPDSDTANARIAIMCLQHMMAEKVPPGDMLSTGLFYCGAYFDHHIRELATLPDELLNLLDRLFNNEPHKFLRILAWRWPLAHENYPDISCPGSPSSMDPVFFMQCTQLDKVPAIWSRYSNGKEPLKSYPEGYLSLAVAAGLEDHAREIIAQGADVNRVDAGEFTPTHLACGPNTPLSMLKIIVDGGADINLRTKEGSPLRMARDMGLVKAAEFLEQHGAIE